MTANDFTFWLKGYLDGAKKPDVKLISEKLKLVNYWNIGYKYPFASTTLTNTMPVDTDTKITSIDSVK